MDGFVKNRTQSVLVSPQGSEYLSEQVSEGVKSDDGKTVIFEVKHSDLDFIRTARLNITAGFAGFFKYHVYYNAVGDGEDWIRILTRKSPYEYAIRSFKELSTYKQGDDEHEHRFNIPIHTNRIKVVFESPFNLSINTYTLSYKLLKWYEFSAYKGISYNSKKINPLGDLQYPKAAVRLHAANSLNNNMVCHSIDNYSETIDLSNSGDDIVKSYFLLRERYTGLRGKADEDTGWMVIGMFRPTKYKENCEIVMQQGYELNSEQDIPFLDNKPLRDFLCDYVLRDDENDLLYPVGKIEPVNKTYSHHEEITLSSGSRLHRLLQGVNDDMIIHYSDIIEKNGYIYVVGISKNDNDDEHRFAYVKKATYCASCRTLKRIDRWYEGGRWHNRIDALYEPNKYGLYLELETEDGEIKYGHEYVNPVFLYKIDTNGNIIRKRELPYFRHFYHHERLAFGHTQQGVFAIMQGKLILKTFASNSAVGHYVFDDDLNLVHKSGTLVFPEAGQIKPSSLDFVTTNVTVDWFGMMKEYSEESEDLYNLVTPTEDTPGYEPPVAHEYTYEILSQRIRKNDGNYESNISGVFYYQMRRDSTATDTLKKLKYGMQFNNFGFNLRGILPDSGDEIKYIFIPEWRIETGNQQGKYRWSGNYHTTDNIAVYSISEDIFNIPRIEYNASTINSSIRGSIDHNLFQTIRSNFVYKKVTGNSYSLRNHLYYWKYPNEDDPVQMASYNGYANTERTRLLYMNINIGSGITANSSVSNRFRYHTSVTCFGDTTDNIMCGYIDYNNISQTFLSLLYNNVIQLAGSNISVTSINPDISYTLDSQNGFLIIDKNSIGDRSNFIKKYYISYYAEPSIGYYETNPQVKDENGNIEMAKEKVKDIIAKSVSALNMNYGIDKYGRLRVFKLWYEQILINGNHSSLLLTDTDAIKDTVILVNKDYEQITCNSTIRNQAGSIKITGSFDEPYYIAIYLKQSKLVETKLTVIKEPVIETDITKIKNHITVEGEKKSIALYPKIVEKLFAVPPVHRAQELNINYDVVSDNGMATEWDKLTDEQLGKIFAVDFDQILLLNKDNVYIKSLDSNILYESSINHEDEWQDWKNYVLKYINIPHEEWNCILTNTKEWRLATEDDRDEWQTQKETEESPLTNLPNNKPLGKGYVLLCRMNNDWGRRETKIYGTLWKYDKVDFNSIVITDTNNLDNYLGNTLKSRIVISPENEQQQVLFSNINNPQLKSDILNKTAYWNHETNTYDWESLCNDNPQLANSVDIFNISIYKKGLRLSFRNWTNQTQFIRVFVMGYSIENKYMIKAERALDKALIDVKRELKENSKYITTQEQAKRKAFYLALHHSNKNRFSSFTIDYNPYIKHQDVEGSIISIDGSYYYIHNITDVKYSSSPQMTLELMKLYGDSKPLKQIPYTVNNQEK